MDTNIDTLEPAESATTLQRPIYWPVALSEEVVDRPFAATVGDTDLALFRNSDGQVNALLDQCAHRRAPLTLGQVVGGCAIACPYHGWQFEGATGRCVVIPNQSADEKIPKAYKVPVFPVLEQDGMVFIATSESAGREAEPTGFENLPVGEASYAHSSLIVYPFEHLVDLLLDAPGAVIDVPGVTVADDHRYGEPLVQDGRIETEVAAYWTRKLRPLEVISDYPLILRIVADLRGSRMRGELRDLSGEVLCSVDIGLSPYGETLTRVLIRGVDLQRHEKPIRMVAREHLDPDRIRAVKRYTSPSRK